MRRTASISIALSLGIVGLNHSPSCSVLAQNAPPDDTTLVDQLKVIRALQLEAQKEELLEERDIATQIEQSYERGQLIARGLIALPPVGAPDPSMYPIGYPSAASLDDIFSNDEAALILTAVSKSGPPVAAKRIQSLKDIKFPLVFEITTDDLLFPYNAEVWKNSPQSTASVSVTCILEPDGKLATAEPQSRFGFAISDPLRPTEVKGQAEPVFMRTDAKISINMKADGRAYSEEERELLSRVDNELDRIQAATAAALEAKTTTGKKR